MYMKVNLKLKFKNLKIVNLKFENIFENMSLSIHYITFIIKNCHKKSLYTINIFTVLRQ